MINIDTLKTIQDYLAINDQPEKCEVIFIFGGIRQPKVWDRALQLYKEDYAPKIFITGGYGPMTKELNLLLPEAETIKNYLIEKRVPQNDIIIETQAVNTLENVKFGIEALRKYGLQPKTIIAISKPFHMRRCLATFNKYFPDINILCCPPSGSIEELMDRPINEYYQRVLDEIKRLIKYADKGDIVRQDIPDEIIKEL